MIMTQAVTLFGVMAIVKLTFDVEDVNETDEEMDFIYTIIYVGVLYLLKSTKNIHIYWILADHINKVKPPFVGQYGILIRQILTLLV